MMARVDSRLSTASLEGAGNGSDGASGHGGAEGGAAAAAAVDSDLRDVIVWLDRARCHLTTAPPQPASGASPNGNGGNGGNGGGGGGGGGGNDVSPFRQRCSAAARLVLAQADAAIRRSVSGGGDSGGGAHDVTADAIRSGGGGGGGWVLRAYDWLLVLAVEDVGPTVARFFVSSTN